MYPTPPSNQVQDQGLSDRQTGNPQASGTGELQQPVSLPNQQQGVSGSSLFSMQGVELAPPATNQTSSSVNVTPVAKSHNYVVWAVGGLITLLLIGLVGGVIWHRRYPTA